jgi:lipopolysaccharide/colanic/teichoic acid biosynthesis glycosyltransferase
VQIKRLNVRPGITGWAQVHGRNELKLSRRFKLDVWYVNNISIILDMKIIYLTIYNLIFSKVVVCRQDLIEVDDLGFDEKAFGNKKI